jgi:hypothetical protein
MPADNALWWALGYRPGDSVPEHIMAAYDEVVERRAHAATRDALAAVEAKRIRRGTEGEDCCRAAVDSDGHAHDHVEWYMDLIEAEAHLERLRSVVEAARAVAAADLFLMGGEYGPTEAERVDQAALDALVAAVDALGPAAPTPRTWTLPSEPGLQAPLTDATPTEATP